MQKDAPKLNNIEIFPPKCHQVTELTKDDEVDQDKLVPGSQYNCYSSDQESCRDNSDTESEFYDYDVIPETQ